MAAKQLTAGQKQALKRMRERLGPIPAERRAAHKQALAARRAIRAALTDGGATVPQIAKQTGLPAHEVLWHVTAMKKYGEVREVGQDGDYVRYALIPTAPAGETQPDE